MGLPQKLLLGLPWMFLLLKEIVHLVDVHSLSQLDDTSLQLPEQLSSYCLYDGHDHASSWDWSEHIKQTV